MPQLIRRWLTHSGALALALATLLTAADAPRPAHAAGIVVNTLADASPPATDGLCSLREAITNANTNAATFPDCPAGAGADTITFGVSGVIPLSLGLPSITDPAGLLIDGGGGYINVNGKTLASPFTVPTVGQLELRGLTVSAGAAGGYGGAVFNAGALTVRGSIFSDNYAYGGGAIFNNGTLAVVDSTFHHNQAIGGSGGAIYNAQGTVTIATSTLNDNTGGFGGAVYGFLGTITIANSTLSGNSGRSGGAAYNDEGLLRVSNSTVIRNAATVFGGGGFLNSDGAIEISNAILAHNTSAGSGPDCRGAVTTAESISLQTSRHALS